MESMTMGNKGTRRERHAEKCYMEAGYRTYRPERAKYGDNDVFGLFDVLAFDPGEGDDERDAELVMVQVKSNRAEGVEQWCDRARAFERIPGVRTEFLVCHDNVGWRVIRPDGDRYSHEVVYDGRKDPTRTMARGLVAFLAGEYGDEVPT